MSGHRLPLAVDGVSSMADNTSMAPGGQKHITLPWALSYVILYRSKDGIGVKFADSFSFEPVGARL